jgi:hypothetical protein
MFFNLCNSCLHIFYGSYYFFMYYEDIHSSSHTHALKVTMNEHTHTLTDVCDIKTSWSKLNSQYIECKKVFCLYILSLWHFERRMRNKKRNMMRNSTVLTPFLSQLHFHTFYTSILRWNGYGMRIDITRYWKNYYTFRFFFLFLSNDFLWENDLS